MGDGRLSRGSEFFVDRAADAERDNAATYRTARADAQLGNLCWVDPVDRAALRTGNVHLPPPSIAFAEVRGVRPCSSTGDASVRRSIENTEPGSVFA